VWRQNEIKPIGEMPSSTNGIVEYTANTFGGQIKGDLFLSKLAINGNPGITFQVNLDGDGNAKGNPFEVWGASGEQVVMSPEGFLVMPQLKYYKVLVLKPASSGTVRMLADGVPAPEVHAVFPPKGRWEGGNTMIVTGRGFRDDTVVRVAGRECEYLELRSPTQMICQVPAGRGVGHVTATTAGIISPVFGTHDYEWI
jgi:IPT/TIG domain